VEELGSISPLPVLVKLHDIVLSEPTVWDVDNGIILARFHVLYVSHGEEKSLDGDGRQQVD
jgi:hypothetical protein